MKNYINKFIIKIGILFIIGVVLVICLYIIERQYLYTKTPEYTKGEISIGEIRQPRVVPRGEHAPIPQSRSGRPDERNQAIIIFTNKETASETIEAGSNISNDSFEAIDKIISSLRAANIVYNLPPGRSLRLELGKEKQIILLLSLDIPKERLEEIIQQNVFTSEKDVFTSEKALISSSMEARLRTAGNGLEITSISDDKQPIPSTGTTTWRWSVKPVSPGYHPLYISLTAWIKTDGGEPQSRTIKTYGKMVIVEVSWEEKFAGFVTKNWAFLTGTIIIPFFLWAGRKAYKSINNNKTDRK